MINIYSPKIFTKNTLHRDAPPVMNQTTTTTGRATTRRRKPRWSEKRRQSLERRMLGSPR